MRSLRIWVNAWCKIFQAFKFLEVIVGTTVNVWNKYILEVILCEAFSSIGDRWLMISTPNEK